MSGHSHWAGIKHKKGVADQKRGQIFSKLLAAITAAARTEPNPDFNPRLRTAVQKARENMVPQDTIARAIARASDPNAALEELLCEAYGPGGIAILVEAITDSKNRTIAELKSLIGDNGGKWAEPGSVRWAFEEIHGAEGMSWMPRFPHPAGPADKEKLGKLIEALSEHADVHKVTAAFT